MKINLKDKSARAKFAVEAQKHLFTSYLFAWLDGKLLVNEIHAKLEQEESKAALGKLGWICYQ